ncbi:MAG: diaminopimelate decarboxylase [Armatimonadota bacterium]|jgi:diaminopimelate decarboxylase
MLLGTQKINALNHLEIGGCDTVDLAAEYGTPLYVMDEEWIRHRCRTYVSSFAAEYGDASVAFASKAFINTAMCRIIDQEGLWLDVASAGELYTAKCAQFPTEKIIFHGNYKSAEELEMAVESGVGLIAPDSLGEIELLSVIAEDAGVRQCVILRCNPGVDPHTHRLISTGQEDSKFGFNIRNGDAMKAVKSVLSHSGLSLAGLHCHIGSQLLDPTPYIEAANVMASLIRQIKDETGAEIGLLNMGGGVGIRYVEEHQPPSIEQYAKLLSESVIVACATVGIDKPRLMVEPGRSISGEAGTTIYSVGPIKECGIPEPPGKRTYLAVDGGLSDNPRPTMYDAVYSALLANKAGSEPTNEYRVSGKHCETDMLISSVLLPDAKTGDLLAVQSTGAYNYAMASNYNRFTRPAVVLVKDGQAELIVRRETLEDLVKCDLVPQRLTK